MNTLNCTNNINKINSGPNGGIDLSATSPFWYGVEKWKPDQSPDLTRIGSMGYHIASVLPCHNAIRGGCQADDGTFNYFFKPDDWTKKADGSASKKDGTDGMVMNRWDDFYYKEEEDVLFWRLKLSPYPISGFTKVDIHSLSAYAMALDRVNNKAASVVNTTAQYRGGDNNAAYDALSTTHLGMAATSFNRTNGRTYARNRGAGWNLYGHDDHKWLYWFYVIEYATLNSQKAVNNTLTASGFRQGGLGNGVTTAISAEWSAYNAYNPFIQCGVTDTLGNGSGEISVTVPNFKGAGISQTFTQCRYRGHEEPFGHLFKITDGNIILIQANDAGAESRLYVSDNPANWNDTDYSQYTMRGLLPRAEGYMKEAIMGATAEFCPSAIGGSSGTYFCDYFYGNIPASGSSIRMLLVGGYALRGASAGFAYSDAYSAPSTAIAYIGSRLRFSAT